MHVGQATARRAVGDAPVFDLVMVDDDSEGLAELSEALEHLGHRPTTFSSGKEAMAHLLRRTRPCIVITDVCMPGMTGLELTRRLRDEREAPAAEIILISANSGISEAIQAVQAGAIDFLMKPVDLTCLTMTIDRAAARIEEWLADQERRTDLADLLTVVAEKAKDLLATSQPPQPQRPPVEPRSSARAPQANGGEPVHPLTLIKLLQGIRRTRDRLFDCCADGDAEWEILLFVHEQEVLGRSVSVTSACHATSIPQTTALRKIDELIGRGFLVRQPDPNDRRRVLLHTTPDCAESLERYLETVGTQIAGAQALFP